MRFGAIRFWRDAFRRQKIDYDWRLNGKIYVLRNASAALKWFRLSEQIFHFDMWSLCRG